MSCRVAEVGRRCWTQRSEGGRPPILGVRWSGRGSGPMHGATSKGVVVACRVEAPRIGSWRDTDSHEIDEGPSHRLVQTRKRKDGRGDAGRAPTEGRHLRSMNPRFFTEGGGARDLGFLDFSRTSSSPPVRHSRVRRSDRDARGSIAPDGAGRKRPRRPRCDPPKRRGVVKRTIPRSTESRSGTHETRVLVFRGLGGRNRSYASRSWNVGAPQGSPSRRDLAGKTPSRRH